MKYITIKGTNFKFKNKKIISVDFFFILKPLKILKVHPHMSKRNFDPPRSSGILEALESSVLLSLKE